MTLTAHGAGAVAASAFALPAIGFAVGPIFEKHEQPWQDVGAAADFPDDTYVPKVITIVEGIGEAGKSTVYVRKRNAQLDTEKAQDRVQPVRRDLHALHAPRLPGALRRARRRFICPCHGGVYDFQGKVVGGPPVRPLDRFYTRVRNGQVEVGPRYSVNRELRRFSPRDPGEPLDGIGQYLYPSRPSVRKIPGT